MRLVRFTSRRLESSGDHAAPPAGGVFMCFLYPCGIPLLFALLMRRERLNKVGKARFALQRLRESF